MLSLSQAARRVGKSQPAACCRPATVTAFVSDDALVARHPIPIVLILSLGAWAMAWSGLALALALRR